MKRILVVVGICFLLIGMPVGISNCGCNNSEQPTVSDEETNAGGLSNEDIVTLQNQGEIEGWTFTVGENPATKHSLDD